MSKPLSAEWNSVIQRFMEGENTRAMLAAAIDEAAFWRSAVRDAIEFPDDCCAFCGTSAMNGHASDCVKLLAQGGG